MSFLKKEQRGRTCPTIFQLKHYGADAETCTLTKDQKVLRIVYVYVDAFGCDCTLCIEKKSPQINGMRVDCLGGSAGKTSSLHGEILSWIPNTINKGELQMH